MKETLTHRPLLDRLSAVSDSLRGRIALLLERNELTVSELCSVFQIPQSTMSRQLRILSESGWIASRPDGPRRLYHMPRQSTDELDGRMWAVLREHLSSVAESETDGQRLRSVLARRRNRSREFFAGEAERWDRLRDELFGPSFYLLSLVGLVEDSWCVGDLGCGTGSVAEALAPFVNRVLAVDVADSMVEAARHRLESFDNVEVRRGELEALPIDDGRLDAATLILVLHHLPDPDEASSGKWPARAATGRATADRGHAPARRVQEYRQQMGHVWMGFSRRTDRAKRLTEVGFEAETRFPGITRRIRRGPQGDRARRARDARPDVDPEEVREREAARRRQGDGLACT